MKVVPIIPSFNPDDTLIKLVSELKKDFDKIIIVNDGSLCNKIFNELEKNRECIILNHEKNLGKGEALKTAFKYYENNLKNDYLGVVCLDSDGQHLVSDVIKVSKLVIDENKFVLGTRLFNTKETPLRNKLGNRITSRVFMWMYKIYLKDTQTGLRAIPNRLINLMINIPGSRFEYELNVLIKLTKLKECITECDIQTVYLRDSNKKSHFKVIKDSFRIYKTMFQGKRI